MSAKESKVKSITVSVQCEAANIEASVGPKLFTIKNKCRSRFSKTMKPPSDYNRFLQVIRLPIHIIPWGIIKLDVLNMIIIKFIVIQIQLEVGDRLTSCIVSVITSPTSLFVS